MAQVKGTPDQGGMAATLGFFIGFAAVSLFGTTASMIKEVMHLSPVLVGFLISAPALSGSLLRIPFSAWTDTTGGRKPFLVLLILSIIGMMGIYCVIKFFYPERLTAGFYPLLFCLGLLCGCGVATFSVGVGQVSYWFPQSRQGNVLGVYAGLGNLAPGIFSFLIPVALKFLGFAGSYLAWLIFLIVGTVVYWRIGRNAWYFQLKSQGLTPESAKQLASQQYGQEIFPKGNFTESLRISAKRWKTGCLVAIYFTTFGGFIALTAWFPTYWKSFYSSNGVTAGTLTALYSILTSLVRVAAGNFSDRWGGERILIGSLFMMLIGSVLMFQSQDFILSLIAAITLAIGMGASNAAVFKLVPQEIPDAVGGAAGWVGGLGAFGGFVIPPLMATIVRQQGEMGYAHGFIIFGILSLVSLLIAVILKQQHEPS